MVGCGRTVKTSGSHIENSPSLGIEVQETSTPNKPEERTVEPEKLTYMPKTTFTSMTYMESIIPPGKDGFELGTVNNKFLKGCYYTGDVSTPFLASFAERWNRIQFFRRFVNAEEIFERENSNYGDSLTTETIRGKMPMLPNEIQLAFKNSECSKKAKRLVKMLTTIDYVPEETERMVNLFNELVKTPYETPEYISEEEIEAVREQFWELYDKERFVKDIKAIQKIRSNENTPADELTTLGNQLKRRYVEESDFDTRCILALEVGCCDDLDAIDYLGELIEDGHYSKFLLEVWLSWRMRAQSEMFGISTFSEIPDNLYDNARLLVANSFLRHIAANPHDKLAKVLLMNLTSVENLHRAGGYYGNEALGAQLFLKSQYFLPEEMTNSDNE
jgi:hypothetical protein